MPCYRSKKAASLPGLEDLSEAFGSESSTQAEIEILKSRSVIGTAANNLGLTTTVSPAYFPYLGDYLARRFVPSDNEPFAAPFLGMSIYAWGGESIKVDRFDVQSGGPDTLTLSVEKGNAYAVTSESGREWQGSVGETLVGDGFELYVSELSARPNTELSCRRNLG